LGVPEKFSGMENVLRNPIYATSIGLLAYGNDRIKNGLVSNSGESFVSKAWSWLKNNY
jgi:cell division protein FtsA